MVTHNSPNVVQFFLNQRAYATEEQLYQRPELGSILPHRFERFDNASASLRAPSGFVYPPLLVMERGESLHEFGRRVAHDPITLVQAVMHVSDRVQRLHALGIVHRDLKPGNILRMPESHSWALIDFGCSAQHGAFRPRLPISLLCTASAGVCALQSVRLQHACRHVRVHTLCPHVHMRRVYR